MAFVLGMQTRKPSTMSTETTTWPDLAIGLYDRLTGRNAEITYEFEDFVLEVPSGTSENAEHATWKMTGTIRIRTNDGNGQAK
jgi:hypothetical protein